MNNLKLRRIQFQYIHQQTIFKQNRIIHEDVDTFKTVDLSQYTA